jgi:hypothetical protein
MFRCQPEFELALGSTSLMSLKDRFPSSLNCSHQFFTSNMVQNKAVVKNVLSGDTVILKGRARANGPPAERLLALSNVQAPRQGNKDKDDEVCSSNLHLSHLPNLWAKM